MQDGKGEKFVMACYAGNPCGCQIKGAGICNDPLRIDFCALHTAAGDLRRTLKETANAINEALKLTPQFPNRVVTLDGEAIDWPSVILNADAAYAAAGGLKKTTNGTGVPADNTTSG
jgi:hypothetical protein